MVTQTLKFSLTLLFSITLELQRSSSSPSTGPICRGAPNASVPNSLVNAAYDGALGSTVEIDCAPGFQSNQAAGGGGTGISVSCSPLNATDGTWSSPTGSCSASTTPPPEWYTTWRWALIVGPCVLLLAAVLCCTAVLVCVCCVCKRQKRRRTAVHVVNNITMPIVYRTTTETAAPQSALRPPAYSLTRTQPPPPPPSQPTIAPPTMPPPPTYSYNAVAAGATKENSAPTPNVTSEALANKVEPQ